MIRWFALCFLILTAYSIAAGSPSTDAALRNASLLQVDNVTKSQFSLYSTNTQKKLNLKLPISTFKSYTSVYRVPSYRTINGFPLTSNITISSVDTATSLVTNGSNCSAGQATLGVDASGNSEGCFTPTGTYSLPTATSSVLGGVKPDGTSVLNTAGVISVTKSSISLGSVENTALSTWNGSTNITTLGTIATGTVPAAKVSGLATSATTDTTNATNITTGTLAAARVATLNQNTTGTAGGLTGTPNISVGTVTASGTVTVNAANVMMAVVNPTNNSIMSVGGNNPVLWATGQASTITLGGYGAMVMVTESATGDAGLFFVTYTSAVITKLSDINSRWLTTDSGTNMAIFKAANTFNFTIKNRTGGNNYLRVNVFGQVNTATAPL